MRFAACFSVGIALFGWLAAPGPVGEVARAAEPAGERAWAYQPPQRPPVPAVTNNAWVVNPIDAFILARLEAAGLAPSPRADKLTLLRRVTFDLTGLPPTLEEQQAFLADDSPDAYCKVVDRLLASPRYGERWAQHWLDVVRYAESDGFKADDLRPFAYRYRDWVIRALNDDLPYDRFIRQQLAGDELEPGNPEALIATGFNRLYPDEYNAANLEQRRQEILDDITDVTGFAFLGLTFACARCHDHKFDPILQKDYYQLQAFFAPLRPRDEPLASDPREQEQYERQRAAWEEATRDLRREMDQLLAGKRAELRKYALGKFRPEIQEAVLTPPEQRTPYQQQIALMAEAQLQRAELDAPKKMTGEQKKRYEALAQQMAAAPQPPELPAVMAIADVGKVPPPTHLLANGDWRKPRDEVQPGFPSFLPAAVPDFRLPPGVESTGRRAALARCLTRPDQPLTASLLVNRIWQHHFGVGIVGTPNDFGSQGDPPTHPELLDWLAVEFVSPSVRTGSADAPAWSLKHIHRLMVTSAAYCQSSRVDPTDPNHAKALAADPENTLLWYARRRRLEGEAVRDAMLHVAGDLNLRMYGPSARPKLPDGISKYAWKPDEKPEDRNRRSIYVLAKRNMRFPLFDTFDLPDMHNSCARRSQTTTAPQALFLLNGEFTLECAERWAARLVTQHPDDRALVAAAYRAAWGRTPTPAEVALGIRFLDAQTSLLRNSPPPVLPAGWPATTDPHRAAAVVDFCHAVLNANEFLYVD